MTLVEYGRRSLVAELAGEKVAPADSPVFSARRGGKNRTILTRHGHPGTRDVADNPRFTNRFRFMFHDNKQQRRRATTSVPNETGQTLNSP